MGTLDILNDLLIVLKKLVKLPVRGTEALNSTSGEMMLRGGKESKYLIVLKN